MDSQIFSAVPVIVVRSKSGRSMDVFLATTDTGGEDCRFFKWSRGTHLQKTWQRLGLHTESQVSLKLEAIESTPE